MFEMNGTSCAFVMWWARPGEHLEQECSSEPRGDDREHERDRYHRSGVLDEHPSAGGDAAAVGGTVPIIAAVFGELNIPEPTPTMNM